MTNISEVITKLYDNTKNAIYHWVSLRSYQSQEFNNVLRDYIIKNQKKYYSAGWRDNSAYLDEQNSYALKTKNGGMFALLSYEYDNLTYYILVAQKTSYGKIVELNVQEELQEELRKLSILVAEQCDSIDDFLRDFLCE